MTPDFDCAFNIGSLDALESISPGNRLSSLLTNGKVYGFYNWLNSPPVRHEQLSRGQDGLFDDELGLSRMLFQEAPQALVDDALHDALDLGRHQLVLGLVTELRVGVLH